MLKINPEHIKMYQMLYAKKTGKEITSAQAQDELMALVCLLDSVHRNMERNNWPSINIEVVPPEKYEFNE